MSDIPSRDLGYGPKSGDWLSVISPIYGYKKIRPLKQLSCKGVRCYSLWVSFLHIAIAEGI